MPRLPKDKLTSSVEHSLEILYNKLLQSTYQKYEDGDDNGGEDDLHIHGKNLFDHGMSHNNLKN